MPIYSRRGSGTAGTRHSGCRGGIRDISGRNEKKISPVMKIIWLPLAKSDMENIYDSYVQKSPTAATKMYNEILDSIEPLREFPEMGVKTAEIGNYIFRAVITGNYRIIYYTSKENIYISTVWDCRRNPKTLINILKERE
jgi:plasmid stabilization system protein ParE